MAGLPSDAALRDRTPAGRRGALAWVWARAEGGAAQLTARLPASPGRCP